MLAHPLLPQRDLPTQPDQVPGWLDELLARAIERAVSDVHFSPQADGVQIQCRVDGLVQPVAALPLALLPNLVARLKVLANLLTYRQDQPQEGRMQSAPQGWEIRVSTFPTLFGERVALRLLGRQLQRTTLEELHLPGRIASQIRQLQDETSGVLLFVGPAGSGKTTSAYAFLRHVATEGTHPRSVLTLEDPIESVLPGIVQSAVHPASGFSYAVGLRSLMRQDPDVILVGEIRDAETAATAFQAGLTGHLVVSTFHAGSACAGLGRLIEMNVEPHVVRSILRLIVSQRLVRRLCSCRRAANGPDELLGLSVSRASVAVGCESCGHTGYRGRVPLAESLSLDLPGLAEGVSHRSSAPELERLARAAGVRTLRDCGSEWVEAGLTSPQELRRVLGVEPWETAHDARPHDALPHEATPEERHAP